LLLRSLSAAYKGLRLDHCYRRVLLFEYAGPVSPVPRSEYSLTVREISQRELVDYQRYRPDCDAAQIAQRLAAGERCFVGWHEARIVCDAWWVFGEVSLFGRLIRLGSRDVWAHRSFVTPELRGRNIDTVRGVVTRAQLWAEGYNRCLFCIWPRNRSSLGSAAKWGAERVGSIGYLRLGPLQFDFEHIRGRPRRWTRRSSRTAVELSLPSG
jgi:hypothetical protein